MLLTVSSFGESFRRTERCGGSIFNINLGYRRNYFLPIGAVSVRMGRTIKKELPFPSTDSTQMRPW